MTDKELPLRSSNWRFLIENTPYPIDIDEWTLLGELRAPVLNVGSYGHGAHTMYERVEKEWSFGKLPLVIEALVKNLLATP